MLLECQRLICYLVIGHILPAWHSGESAWQSEATSSATSPRTKLLQLPQAHMYKDRPADSAAELHMGLDPGLWALSQLFHCSWAHVCSRPIAVSSQPGAHAHRGCLYCGKMAQKASRCASETLACEHSAGLHAPTMAETNSCRILYAAPAAEPPNACVTCTAAPLLVAQVPPGAPPGHNLHALRSVPQQLGAGIRLQSVGAGDCTSHTAVMWPEGGRFGTHLHDLAPHEHVLQLLHVLGDHLEPAAEQVRALGSFRACADGACGARAPVDGPPAERRARADVHVDLLQGMWGGAVRREMVHAEVALRQGLQALVPGQLSGYFAGFVAPALGLPPSLLHAGVQALQKCAGARLWTGCHQ
jgi:hypothetical protein